jgi:hypothetical protein
MTSSQQKRRTFGPALKLSALAVGLAVSASASAVQFKFDNGVSGSFDTTLSYGLSIRTESADPSLIGIANGGTSRSVNEDDGNRSYNKNRPFANVIKGTHELSIKWEDWTLFARGTYFTDFENRGRSNLGPEGRKRVGEGARMLDAFVGKGFDVFGNNARIRLGNQVISWGESTFIPNGINVINAVDLVKLRAPGSELKEAFLPTSSIWGSFEITKNASLEAFAQFNHDKIKLDPRGSYWSNNDFASDDANQVFLAFGRRLDLTGVAPRNPVSPATPQIGATAQALFGPFTPAAQIWAPRGPDKKTSDNGQYGIAFRYLAPEFNNTEFGIYYMNYHSRIPFLSGTKGTVTSALTGSPLGAPTGQTGTASYFVEYPEDIRLLGFSFNTQGPFGVALQGEFSYRPNQPLAYAAPEVLLAALGLPNLLTGFTTIPGTVSATLPFGASAAGLVPNGTLLQGWERVKVQQFQMTATKSVPSFLGAEQLVMVGEVGFTRYPGLRSDIKFNGPAVYLPATSQGAIAGQAGSVQTDGFVTENSWGYRLVGRLEYANAFLGSNLAPRIAFNHDVKGVSQTFNEGVKSVSIGANIDYQRKFSIDLSYTSFFGGKKFCGTDTVVNAAAQTSLAAQIAGVPGFSAPQGASFCSSANPIRDRDFASLVVTYSF